MPLSHNTPVISRFLWMKVHPPLHRRRPFPEGWTHALSFNLGSRHWPFPLRRTFSCLCAPQTLLRLLAMPANPPATYRFAWFEKGLPDGYISSGIFPV